jgi:hypothetical protein
VDAELLVMNDDSTMWVFIITLTKLLSSHRPLPKPC